MGSSPRSSNFTDGQKLYTTNLGQDTDGITEDFQFHDIILDNKQIKLKPSDKFFREAFSPMHLMNFKFFNSILDKFLKWC